MMYPQTQRRGGGGMFLLCLLFGLYFLNYTFEFVKLPAGIDTVNKWIIMFGGVLLIFGGIKFLARR
jgi:hypothetical protein